ncbi:MAG: sugar O-acetyltransferase [Planctomycetota bacterium]|nr:sugar O-acetyltransferase [Planctomycetota bacterium]
MPTEKEKMLAGELYLASDPELTALRLRCRALTERYNATRADQTQERADIIRQLFGSVGPGAEIEPTFKCDYGFNIHAGERLFMNFDCVILDVMPVRIGDACYFAPGVHIYAATHPIDAALRTSGPEFGKPVTIGNRVWLGGRTVVLPGVSIGDDAVIGAGSVVTRDIPPRVVAAGNPCRVIRPV